jgi:hypothetical protein
MSIKKRYDLMIPGPVSVEDEVLAEMAQPIVAHYGREWSDLFNETVEMAKQVFQTQSDLFIMVGSGHYGVEAALNSLVEPGEDVILVETGHFGHRAVELANSHLAKTHVIDVGWDDTVKPEQVAEARTVKGEGPVSLLPFNRCGFTHAAIVTPVAQYYPNLTAGCRGFLIVSVSLVPAARTTITIAGVSIPTAPACHTFSSTIIASPALAW